MASATEILAKLSLDDKEFSSKLSAAQKSLLTFSAAAVGLGATFVALAKGAANYNEKMGQLAQAAGASVSSFSALTLEAKKAGVSNEALSAAFAKLGSRTPEMTKKLGQLGISLRDAGGGAKTNDELFRNLADKVKSYGDAGSQAAVATAILGESGAKLVPMLSAGAKGLDAAAKNAQRLGLVVSDEAAAAAAKFNGDLANMTGALQGLTNAIGESVIEFANQNGIIETITDTIASLTQWWRDLDADTRNYIVGAVAVAAAVAGIALVLAGIVAIAPAVGAAFAIMFGPVGLIVAAIAAAAAGIKLLIDYLDKDGVKAAQKNADASASLAASWGDATGKLYDLSKKSKLTSSDLIELGKLKQKVAMAAREAGDAIDVETMSLKELTAASDNYAKMSVRKAIADQMQLMTALYNSVQNATQQVEREYLLAKGFLDAGEQDAAARNSENYKRATKDYAAAKKNLDDVKARAAAAGLEFQRLNEQLSKTPEQLSKTNSAKVFGGVKEQTAQIVQFASPVVASFRDIERAALIMSKKTKEEIAALPEALKEFDLETAKMQRSNASALGQAGEAWASFAQSVVVAVGGAMSAAKAITGVMSKATQYDAAVAARDLDVIGIRAEKAYEKNKKNLEEAAAAENDALEEAYAEKIATVTNGEASISAAIEFERNKRLLADDEEYQAALDALKLSFENKKLAIEENSLDEEQRKLNAAVAEQSYQQQLTNLATTFANKRKATDDEFNLKASVSKKAADDKIKLLEEQKNKALEDAKNKQNAAMTALDEKKAKDDKDLEKKKLQVQYDAQVQEFEQTRAVQSVETSMAGISAAAQAFSALAKIPFIGPALGIAAAAVIMGAAAASVSQINSQKPIKPAALVAASGGTLTNGETHNGPNGGVSVLAERGETILSRSLTDKLDSSLDAPQGQTIIFQDGAVRLLELSEDLISRLAVAVGDEIRRGGLSVA